MNHTDPIAQRRRKIIIIGISIFTIAIIWSVIVLIGRSGKVGLYISTVPKDATVVIDNTQYGRGTKWLAPGIYQAKVSKDGFESIKRTVVVSEDKEQNVLAVSLVPKSNEAKEWAKKHESDYKKNEQYGAIEASQNGKYFTKNNPITAKLPFKDPYFTIGYTVDEKQSITITIKTPSPRYRFYAIEKIREFGYDPTDFRIVFSDFKNPLEQSDE